MPEPIGRPFVKGRSGSAATQFKPGQSGNPHGRPKGRHAIIMRTRIAASLRKSLKLPLGATYEDVITLALMAVAKTLPKQENGDSPSEQAPDQAKRHFPRFQKQERGVPILLFDRQEGA